LQVAAGGEKGAEGTGDKQILRTISQRDNLFYVQTVPVMEMP